MSAKIIQYSLTPITPELTMVVIPDCRVISIGGPAGSDCPRKPVMRDLLLAVLSDTESLLEHLEQYQEKSTVPR